MKKGIIVNLKSFKVLNYVTLNKIFILLCSFFILGVFLGSFLTTKNTWISENAKAFFENFISIHSNRSFFKKIISCLTKYFFVLIIYFLSGSSIIGIVSTPFLTIWQGIITGSITSFLYTTYGLSGIAFNAIILIPPSAIFVVSCFFAAKFSIEFSLDLIKLTMPKSRPTNLYASFKRFSTNYLILTSISVACCLVEIILNILFLKFFNF